ncbi:MAG TPA: hypothetical protein DD401_01005 [Prevotella sp.]|nr:hypothetical protein [Prevotella sp.]
MSISADSVASAYAFFHQKWRIYDHSTIPTQRDDIEYAISSYASSMDRQLYDFLSEGHPDFLMTHTRFRNDMKSALDSLQKLL